jgi:DNA-binding HxlR family transcriptional regulator
LAAGRADKRKLRSLFEAFGFQASKFSRRILPGPDPVSPSDSVDLNLRIARAFFGKWAPELVVALYTAKRMGFEDLRKKLRPISRRVLSAKLKKLEAMGIVRRDILSHRPQRVVYALTDEGLLAARLAEPFFLFLRLELDSREKRRQTRLRLP